MVLAPNAFKGTLSATDAATAMASGVHRAWPSATTVAVPIADGGDGSLDAFVSAGFTRRAVLTRGPTGSVVSASIAVRGRTGVIELADACGMSRLPDGVLAPMSSSTLGLGDALLAALDEPLTRIIVCIGGSASTDGGTGLLTALGARLTDAGGGDVTPDGEHLSTIAGIDLAPARARLRDVQLLVAADVTSLLTGPAGAAALFAPQKGASSTEVEALERGMTHWGHVLADACGHDVARQPGAGAAGGTGAALLALGASIRPGFDVVSDALGLDGLLAGAALVITGEGRLDEQSLLGKGSVAVARLASEAGCPVLAVCGQIDVPADALVAEGLTGWADLSGAEGGEVATQVARTTEAAVHRWAHG